MGTVLMLTIVTVNRFTFEVLVVVEVDITFSELLIVGNICEIS